MGITLAMFGDVLSATPDVSKAVAYENASSKYSVKPGSVLFDRMLWTRNAAVEPCDAFDESSNCDLMIIMGTSLSGLTIDNCAHIAGSSQIPRVIFDLGTAPVESLGRSWKDDRDCFCQGGIDLSILTILKKLGWLNQIYNENTGFLSELCIGSLRTLKDFMQADADEEVMKR